eukprot:6713584-Heterocapsa_arctica.AAC.1
MLRDMGEAQALANLQQAKNTRSTMRELQEELITKIGTGALTDTRTEENNKKRKDNDEDKDHRKREEEE